jgi:hypothetical protein
VDSLIAVYNNLKDAEQAVHVLDRANFPRDQISLVSAWTQATPELIEELKMGDDSIRDAAIGAGLGGVLGVIAGLGAMVVSGLGLVFISGPIGGGVFGATVGAFLGTFIGWGIHEGHIKHYEKCVREGKVLVIAHGGPLETQKAERILEETNAEEISLHARESADSPEILKS